jgi:hypothetical protein
MMSANMKKGKKAEKIVADLFKEAGFKVVKYGYEHTVPDLADRNNLIKGRAADYIRHQPDFIVVNKRNEAFFVEVKHRSKVIMPEKDIFPYPNCYVVLLTKGAILAQSTDFLFRKGATFGLLKDMPPFTGISYELIEKYVMKLRRQLGDDTFVEQFMGKIVKKITNLNVSVKKADPVKVVPVKVARPKIHDADVIKTTKGNTYYRMSSHPQWVAVKIKNFFISGKYKNGGKMDVIGKTYRYIIVKDRARSPIKVYGRKRSR